VSSASPPPARTSCTASSADTNVSWCTPRTSRPRWWPGCQGKRGGPPRHAANALGLVLRAPQGQPFERKRAGAGELVTEVLLDAPQPGTRGAYRKARERGAFDFALAGAAIVLTMAEGKVKTARLVLSGVAPVPWRSAEAEQALVGKPLDAATAGAAAAAAVKAAVPLRDNGYKVPLVRGLLEESLIALAV